MTFKEIKNIKKDLILLQSFLDNAGNSLETFKYFSRRELNCIKNHYLTVLLLDDNKIPVCYGHLDNSNDIIWLGICTSEKYKGNGFGSMMMKYLIDFIKNKRIAEVILKVRMFNTSAILLFSKYQFKLTEIGKDGYVTMKFKLEN